MSWSNVRSDSGDGMAGDQVRMRRQQGCEVGEYRHFRRADVEGGDIQLTESGKQFADLGVDDRKRLLQRQLMNYVPLAAHIRRVLQERANHTAPKSRFLDELEDHMASDAAEQTLRAVVAWARFAEARGAR